MVRSITPACKAAGSKKDVLIRDDGFMLTRIGAV
jgi:hypothetical protein